MAAEREELLIRSPQQVVEALAALRASVGDGVVAFDGDGTLWSGDVGEDVFHYVVSRGLLRAPAREALAREAEAFGVDPSGSASSVAARLFAAYIEGRYPERDVCGMMSWCYAGFTLSELAVSIDRAFEEKQLAARLNREIEPILTFARSAGLRVIVVSASPQPVVERAAHLWGFTPDEVAACPPACAPDGTILPELAHPVPYAETKLTALSRVSAGRSLLGSFGDNVFDLELLRAARLAVAVRPKPALRARLSEVPGIVVLEPQR